MVEDGPHESNIHNSLKNKMCLWNKNAQNGYFSIKVIAKVARSLTLVSFERVRVMVCMPNMKSLSVTVPLWSRLNHFAIDPVKDTRCPWIQPAIQPLISVLGA